jgi:carboxymethylenebutenolidase
MKAWSSDFSATPISLTCCRLYGEVCYTASQRAMIDLWEEHTSYEFEAHSTEKTLATMVADPVNINVPLLTGGVGLEEVRKYYSEYFIPKNLTLLSRTVGEDRVVDELIHSFTHTTQMDWMLPGVPRPAKG